MCFNDISIGKDPLIHTKSTYWSPLLESSLHSSHALSGTAWVSRVALTESAMDWYLVDVVGMGGSSEHSSAFLIALMSVIGWAGYGGHI